MWTLSILHNTRMLFLSEVFFLNPSPPFCDYALQRRKKVWNLKLGSQRYCELVVVGVDTSVDNRWSTTAELGCTPDQFFGVELVAIIFQLPVVNVRYTCNSLSSYYYITCWWIYNWWDYIFHVLMDLQVMRLHTLTRFSQELTNENWDIYFSTLPKCKKVGLI